MTRDETVVAVITFVVSLFATGLVAAAAAFGPWRRRDRALARLANLSSLVSSQALDDVARERMGKQLVAEVDALWIDDTYRRPRLVQLTIYLVAGTGFAAAVYFSTDRALWLQVLLIGGGFLLMTGALGITNVPPHLWKMPGFLSASSPSVGDRRPPRTALFAEQAVLAASITEGTRVLLCQGSIADFALLRHHAGDAGFVLAITADARKQTWMDAARHRNNWQNAGFRESMDGLPEQSFDVAVILRRGRLAVPQDLYAELETLTRLVRSGGHLFVANDPSLHSKGQLQQIVEMVSNHFTLEDVRPLGQRGGMILARRE